MVPQLIGAVLLVAAVLKMVGGPYDLVPIAITAADPWVELAHISFELSVGFWFLLGRPTRASGALALTTFSVFAAVGLRAAWRGQTDCGCFGPVPVSPLVTVALNSALLALVASLWPWRAASHTHAGDNWVTVATATLLVAGLTAGVVVYGSVGQARDVLLGSPVTLYPSAVRLGEVAAGEVREIVVTATNQTGHPVRLIGGTSDCTCLATVGLPIDLPPGGRHPVVVRLLGTAQAGDFRRSARLETDSPGGVRPTLLLHGRNTGQPDAR